jgi:hypothetical protein
MNTLYDVFARRAIDAEPADLDVTALIGRGEQRLRRRRLAAVLGRATAVVAVIAIAVGMALNGPEPRGQGPVDRPPSQGDDSGGPRPDEQAPVRRIVYSDTTTKPSGLGATTVHYGSRVVDADIGFTFMDVTDDGFVYLARGHLWFTDGGKPERIASDLCADEAGFRGRQVKTAHAGSHVAWFDCSGPAHAALVVYDTHQGREVVRQELRRCSLAGAWGGCGLDAVIGDHVYFTRGHYPHGGRIVLDPLVYDLGTHRVSAAGSSYLDDVRSHPRGFVVGDSWESGTPTDSLGFSVVGRRLVPEAPEGTPPGPTSAFDTATGLAVHLRLPAGYRGGRGFATFEWLDDDTVAMIGATGWGDAPGYGDILRCRLSDGTCALAARGHGPVRVAANGGLPG